MNEVMLDSAIISALNDELQEKDKQLQVYKDKYSDLETDYTKSVENEKTLRYTVNKYYDELQAYKDKEDKLREELLIWGEVINPTLQENILLTIESGE